MKHLIKLSTATIVAFMLMAPSFAEEKQNAAAPKVGPAQVGPGWWTSDKFKAKFADWAAKFGAAHEAMMKAREANKTISAAQKAEKDRAAKAKMVPEIINKRLAVWDSEIAWLELHKEWKKFEYERAFKQWDEQIAKKKETIAKAKETLAKLSEPPKK